MTDLQTRIRQLRARARHAVWLHGASWLVAVLLGAALLLGLFDWALHVDSDASRFLLVLTALIGLGVLAWRVLVRPLRQQLSDVAVALKIERRYPGLHDSLASTVQFSESHRDPRFGSPELQQRVIEQTESKLQGLDLDDVIETRDVRLASFAAIGVCLLVAVVAGLRPLEASIALRRMVFPFSAADWPRQVHLQLRDADLKVIPLEAGESFGRVEGDNFKFYVENSKGPLPEDVTLHLRYGDGETDALRLRRVTIRDDDGRTRTFCVANVLVERGPVRFRVVGGDDHTMREQTLRVVPAPRIESLQVTLDPPAYLSPPAGRNAADAKQKRRIRLPKNVGHVEALVGTEVRVEAVANKPLDPQGCILRVKNEPARKLVVSGDGRTFTATFLVRESGNYSYWFDLTDREGFSNPSAPRYDVRAVADRVPIVRLAEPAEDLAVTPGAALVVKYSVEDDLRVRSAALRHRHGDRMKGRYETVPLFAEPLAKPLSPIPSAKDGPARERTGEYRWTLPRLAPGTTVRFYVEAEDDFDLDADARPDPSGRSKHVGESITRLLTIVSPAEKSAEIARRYGGLLDELARLQRRQQEARGQVQQLRIQLEKAGRLRTDDALLLKRVARDQRDIAGRLVGGKQGLKDRAAALARQLRQNHLDNPPLLRRLNRIVAELDSLQRTPLKRVQAELREVEAAAGDNGKPPAKTPPATPKSAREQATRLRSVAGRQQEVLRSLRDLVAELSEWRNWQDLSTELKGLVRRQDDVHREAERLKPRTLGKLFDELTDQQRADLARIGEQQRRLGRQLDQLRRSIGTFRNKLQSDPEPDRAAGQILADAEALIRDQALVERMQNAAGQIERNQLGRTSARLKKLADELRELQAVLENRGSDDLETLIKKQKQAEDELLALKKQQEDVAETLRKLGDAPRTRRERESLQQLIKRQQQLQRKTAEMARKLRRLSANDANRALQRAGNNMQRSLDALQREALEQGRIEQRDVLDDLEQARRQLARTRQRLEALLAREKMERLAAEIDGLLRRQQNVIAGTSRLHNESERTRNWTRGRLITLDTIRDEQLRLQRRLDELSQSTGTAAVFSLALQRISDSMRDAAAALRAARDDAAAQLPAALEHERTAKRQLQELAKTLRPDEHRRPGAPDQAGDGQNGSGASDADGPSLLVQLKLLKALQDELADHTREFDKARKPDEQLTPARQAAAKTLAGRQAKLSDLTHDLMRKLGVNPDDAKSEPGDRPQKLQESDDLRPDQRLKRVARNMQTAAGRLDQAQTGKTTAALQKQISDDLQALIDSARRQSPSAGQQSSRKTRAQKKSQKRNGSEKRGKAKGSGRQGTTAGEPNTGKKKSRNSQQNVRSPEQIRQFRIARQQRLINEVWGQLPEHVKQQLRNVAGEKSLPRYKPLINKYFESLAE